MDDDFDSAKIIQILPAVGYLAVTADMDWEKDHHGGPAMTEPLVCWALIEHKDGSRQVTGMTMEEDCSVLVFPSTSYNFVGYMREGTRQEDLISMCLNFMNDEKFRKQEKLRREELCKKKEDV